MYKNRFQNLFFEICDYVKGNLPKFFTAILLFVVAIGLSVFNALNITDVNAYLLTHNGSALLLMTGDGNSVAYFFARFFLIAVIAALILVFSVHLSLAWINYILLFFYAYTTCLYITLYAILFKFSVVPLLLLCLLPCLIVSYVLLMFLTVSSFNRGCDRKRFGSSKQSCFKPYLISVSPLLIMLGILCILEAILTYFLTLGLLL